MKNRDILLPVLIIVILTIYLPGLSWGIPYATGADRVHAWGNDDQVPLAPLAEMHNTFFNAKPDRNVAYPWFHYFLLASAFAPYLALVYLRGGIEFPGSGYPEYPFGLKDPVTVFWNLTLIGRLVTLLLALAVVLGAYLMGKYLWGRKAGVVSAVLSCLMFPMAYYARVGNFDVPALGWTSLGLAVFALILRRGMTVRRGVMLGVLVALGTATKDQAFGSFVLLGPVLLWIHFRRSWAELGRAGVRIVYPAAAMVGSFLAVYVLASGILVDPQRYIQHASKVLSAGLTRTLYLRYPATPAGYMAQARDLVGHLIDVLGWPVLILVAIGVLFAVRWDRPACTLLFSSMGFFLMLLPVGLSRIHHLLPVALPLNAFAGYAVVRARKGKPLFYWSTVIATFAGILHLVLINVNLTHNMIFDSRYAAGMWLNARLKQGDSILNFGFTDKMPYLPEFVSTYHVFSTSDALPTIRQVRPDFVLVIPQDINEDRQRIEWREGWHSVVSPSLPRDVFFRLADGSMGYRLVAKFQTPQLFPWLNRPFLSYPSVNPPVQIFARVDRAQGMQALEPWVTAPHYPRFIRVDELTIDS